MIMMLISSNLIRTAMSRRVLMQFNVDFDQYDISAAFDDKYVWKKMKKRSKYIHCRDGQEWESVKAVCGRLLLILSPALINQDFWPRWILHNFHDGCEEYRCWHSVNC